MNIHIYYGSLAAFTEKLPNSYDSIVDLAIRDDEKHRKLKFDDGRDYTDDQLPYYENVVAFSDDYPALTESLIESFVSFIFRFDIDNLFLQNPPDSIAKHIAELSSAEHSIERQDYKVLNMGMLKEIKLEFPDAIMDNLLPRGKLLVHCMMLQRDALVNHVLCYSMEIRASEKRKPPNILPKSSTRSCFASNFLCCTARNLPRTYLVESIIKTALPRNFLSENQM